MLAGDDTTRPVSWHHVNAPSSPHTGGGQARSGGGLHAAHGPQHLPLEQHGGHLRDALFQRGQRGVHGGAGRVNLVAELSRLSIHMSIHRSGASQPFLL